MTDTSRLIFDGEKGKLFFKGDCLEALGTCKAFCCKKAWDLNISREEFESGRYEAEIFCKTDDGTCANDAADCLYKGYRLKRGPAGHCIYLGADNRCSIHESKPKVCKDFRCEEGWSLERVPGSAGKAAPEIPEEERLLCVDARMLKDFKRRVSDDMLFIINPSHPLKTTLYLKEKKKLVAICAPVDRCGKSIKQYVFHQPALDDESLLYLAGLFDGINSLSDILRLMNTKYAVGLAIDDLYEITCLFYHAGIVIQKSPA